MLEDEGVEKFEQSWNELIEVVQAKLDQHNDPAAKSA